MEVAILVLVLSGVASGQEAITVILVTPSYSCPACEQYKVVAKEFEMSNPDVYFAKGVAKEREEWISTEEGQRPDGVASGYSYRVNPQSVFCYPTFIVMRGDTEQFRMYGYNAKRSGRHLSQLIQFTRESREAQTP